MIDRGVLLDNSAWARLSARDLPQSRVDEVAAALESGRIHVGIPFLLEAGYSARNSSEHAQLVESLLALPWADIDDEVERAAIDAQRALARAGRHRLPPVDLLMSALAHRHGLGILHYDADYETILDKTSLRFDSVWLAARGTLA